MYVKFLVLCALIPVISSGCFRTVILPLPAPRNGQNRADLHLTGRSYILGYFEGKSGRAECRDGVESLIIFRDAIDAFVHFFIGGIYTTRSAEVRCVRPHLRSEELLRMKTQVLHGVYFDSNSARIQGDSHLVLDELATFLRENPGIHVTITGHTDLTGGFLENERLSIGRAAAAKEYLTARGVNPGRINIEGRGGRTPLIPAFDEDSSAVNRRIEVTPTRYPAAPNSSFKPVAPDVDSGRTGERATVTRIIMLDGTIFTGTILDQTNDRIVTEIDGRRIVLMKDRVKKIEYGRKR